MVDPKLLHHIWSSSPPKPSIPQGPTPKPPGTSKLQDYSFSCRIQLSSSPQKLILEGLWNQLDILLFVLRSFRLLLALSFFSFHFVFHYCLSKLVIFESDEWSFNSQKLLLWESFWSLRCHWTQIFFFYCKADPAALLKLCFMFVTAFQSVFDHYT